MKQNGRKPSALSLVPKRLERVERLQPPDTLDQEERTIWVDIVNGHPADWFDAGAVPVLAQLCRHSAVANRLSTMIGRVGDNGTLLNLLMHQRSESDVIRKLATSLRLTPQALINHNGNKNKPISAIHSPHSLTG